MVAYGIISITYIIEYSFFGSHGALLLQLRPDAAGLAELGATLSTPGRQTLVRVPLLLSMSVVFVMIVREAITPRIVRS
jgi:hypothetical protein